MNANSPASVRNPLLMGVLNLTPDSFSDGGDFGDPGVAVAHFHRLVADGADVVDLGAESTRPGARSISEREEWQRLEPVLERLAQTPQRTAISVDTRRPTIMRRALDYGATWYNDVSGCATTAELAELASHRQIQYIAMHMPMTPDMMQQQAMPPGAALASVASFFDERQNSALQAGLTPEQVWLDPGIGFGKTDAANLQLMQQVGRWSADFQIAVGVSRKSLIGRALGIADPKDRDPPSKMLELGLVMLGARLVRTHRIAPLRRLVSLLREPTSG